MKLVTMSELSDKLTNAPLGTKAPAMIGGYWVKVTNGWQWPMGSIYPRPGGDWTGELIYPGACEEHELV